jgi:pyridoxamine 5'-phosphate oxidase
LTARASKASGGGARPARARAAMLAANFQPSTPRVSGDESDDYFATRPRGSQVAAWASNQSKPIESRAALEEQFHAADERFEGDGDVPRPDFWGGFRIVPTRMEFWKGRSNRMHDRIVFERVGDNWSVTRLQP